MCDHSYCNAAQGRIASFLCGYAAMIVGSFGWTEELYRGFAWLYLLFAAAKPAL
jgi:hypothetical protein